MASLKNGRSGPPESPAQAMMRMKQELLESIHSLGEEESSACLEAIARVPHLVQSESDPELFLRREDLDAPAAARRLCSYWKERLDIFGNRAFLPMDLSGNGALSEDQVELIGTGSMVILPKDNLGRPILFVVNRFPKGDTRFMDFVAYGRFFFLNRMWMENPDAVVEEGIIMLRLLERGTVFNKAMITRGSKMLQQCMPIRVHSGHFCCPVDSGSQNYVRRTLVPVVMQSFGKELSSRTHIHVATESADFLKKLVEYDFDADGIPACCGGSYTMSKFESWFKSERNAAKTRPASVTWNGVVVTDPKQIDMVKQITAFQAEQATLAEEITGLLGDVSKKDLMDLVSETASSEALEAHDNVVLSVVQSLTPTSPTLAQSQCEIVTTRVEFFLGALALLQEELQCSLHDLLRDEATEEILRGVLGMSAPSAGIPSHDTIPIGATSSYAVAVDAMASPKQAEAQSLAQSLIEAAQSDEYGSNGTYSVLPQELSETLYGRIRSALEMLAVLEHRRNCSLNDLLNDAATTDLIRDLVGLPMPVLLGSKGQSTSKSQECMDCLAGGLAEKVLEMDDKTAQELQDQLRSSNYSGDYPEHVYEMISSLVGTRL